MKTLFAKAKNYKKGLYLQDYLERRHLFTPMAYSVEEIPEAEALVALERLAALLSFKLK